MSSRVPSTLLAAAAMSSTISRVRSRVELAPSAEACRARSTVERTAARASASTPLSAFLSFLSFFLSFAMATGNSSSITRCMSPETIHLRPHEPVAERVLLPGDPGRALRLAQQLITGVPKMLNHNRGLWGYSGIAADGHPLTVQATGMGGASAAIVAEELIMLGARRLLRTGTCGALSDSLVLGQLVSASAALPED